MGWLADVADFNFEIKYLSGKSNVNVDVLSWNSFDDSSDLPAEGAVNRSVLQKKLQHIFHLIFHKTSDSCRKVMSTSAEYYSL